MAGVTSEGTNAFTSPVVTLGCFYGHELRQGSLFVWFFYQFQTLWQLPARQDPQVEHKARLTTNFPGWRSALPIWKATNWSFGVLRSSQIDNFPLWSKGVSKWRGQRLLQWWIMASWFELVTQERSFFAFSNMPNVEEGPSPYTVDSRPDSTPPLNCNQHGRPFLVQVNPAVYALQSCHVTSEEPHLKV